MERVIPSAGRIYKESKKAISIRKYFEKNNYPVNAMDRETGKTLFCYAVENEDVKTARYLIECGVCDDISSVICKYGNTHTFELLKEEIPINQDLLTLATSYTNFDLCRHFVCNYNLRPISQDSSGETPLHKSIRFCKWNFAIWFIEKANSYELDNINYTNKTPYMLCEDICTPIIRKRIEILQNLLVHRGASKKQKDNMSLGMS
jgi:hypothetical protein